MLEDPENIKLIFIALFGTIFLVTIAVVLLFIVFNNKKNKLIQTNLQAKIEDQKRRHDLELKALRGQMNPHFVHNSLNAIQYYIQQNEVEKSETYLAKFSKLMRQFFDFSRRKTVSLQEEVSLIKNYLYIEKMRFEEKIDFKINVDDKLDVEEEHIPSMILQPIVENAINHGLFHKKGKGKLNINFQQIKTNCFRVSIEDNGIGIKASKTLNKPLEHKKTSHSSAAIEERIHFLNQSSNYEVSYSILDLSDEDQKETGTRVTLTFNHNYNDED